MNNNRRSMGNDMNNDKGKEVLINKDKAPEYAKKEMLENKKRAMELLEKTESFLLITKNNEEMAIVSGMSMGEVPNFMNMIKQWFESCLRQRDKIENHLEGDTSEGN